MHDRSYNLPSTCPKPVELIDVPSQSSTLLNKHLSALRKIVQDYTRALHTHATSRNMALQQQKHYSFFYQSASEQTVNHTFETNRQSKTGDQHLRQFFSSDRSSHACAYMYAHTRHTHDIKAQTLICIGRQNVQTRMHSDTHTSHMHIVIHSSHQCSHNPAGAEGQANAKMSESQQKSMHTFCTAAEAQHTQHPRKQLHTHR